VTNKLTDQHLSYITTLYYIYTISYKKYKYTFTNPALETNAEIKSSLMLLVYLFNSFLVLGICFLASILY
jgi:hypothetical protein